jgi:hypothetical protein
MKCNGHKHFPRCGCPWGPREGKGGRVKPAGRIIARKGYQSASYYWNEAEDRSGRRCNSTLFELAEIYGSITVRVKCWYCPRVIYLHARDNGAFVAFNELGHGWPIHSCEGFRQKPEHYRTLKWEWSAKFAVPVADGTPFDDPDELEEGQELAGTVVRMSEKPVINQGFRAWPATIHTGNVLYNLKFDRPISPGSFIRGIVTTLKTSCFGWRYLRKIEQISPPVE